MSKTNGMVTMSFESFLELAKKAAYLELLRDAALGRVPADDVAKAVEAKLATDEKREADGARETGEDARAEAEATTESVAADDAGAGETEETPGDANAEGGAPKAVEESGQAAAQEAPDAETKAPKAAKREKRDANDEKKMTAAQANKAPAHRRLVNASMLDEENVQEIDVEEKGVKKRKMIDVGKIMALKEAGWTRAQIADEMRLTPMAVTQALYRDRKKKEAKAEG